jgi:hypothetical protein
MSEERYIEERLNRQDEKLECLEKKLDDVLELVSLGKHVAAFAKVLGWIGGFYIALETYLRQVLHK